jgi:hypothetical protein
LLLTIILRADWSSVHSVNAQTALRRVLWDCLYLLLFGPNLSILSINRLKPSGYYMYHRL